MKWRRWVIGIGFLLALLGLYSVRRSIVVSFLSSRFSARVESETLEASLDSVRWTEGSIELRDGRSIEVGDGHALFDAGTLWASTLWKGDLVVDELELHGVRIPAELPRSTTLSLPSFPDEYGTVPDVESWAEAWLSDAVGGIDREAGRVLLASQELHSRYEQLAADLDRTIESSPKDLHDRKQASLMAQQYHGIQQRLAELRIQSRTSGRELARKWSMVADSVGEKFRSRSLGMVPDSEHQIEQFAKAYSQRITPTVLAYCDIVAAAMNPRGMAQAHERSRRTTVVRKATLSGLLSDSKRGNLQVPFECQSCQWAWDSPSHLPTTSVWNFELPDGQGALEVFAEQKPSLLQMTCYWYISRGQQAFQANPSRIRIQIEQSVDDRSVSITAPWAIEQQARKDTSRGLSPLTFTIREPAGSPSDVRGRTVPVAFESVAIEPRVLFEIESEFKANKQRWLREVQDRWDRALGSMVASKQEASVRLWEQKSAETIESLLDLDRKLGVWQERWDCSTSLAQYRVGNRLSAHPDAYQRPPAR